MKNYEGLVVALREVFSIFSQLAETLVILPAEGIQQTIESVLRAALDESTLEFKQIVEAPILEGKNKKQVLQGSINAMLEYIDFGQIGGDALLSMIANYLRNESYVVLPSFMHVPMKETVYAGQAGTAGGHVGDDFPQKQFPTRKRVMPGDTSDTADLAEMAIQSIQWYDDPQSLEEIISFST